MKFSKIIGKIDPKIIEPAQKHLSTIFLELGIKPENQTIGSKLGGNPLIFALVYPMQHIATMAIPTAATDGRYFYWNPEFILSLDLVGLRLVVEHEAFHAIYLHPQRIGKKHRKLWGLAVDYMVHHFVFDGLKKRGKNPHEIFTKHLGRYYTLDQAVARYQNPDKPIPGFEDIYDSIKNEMQDLLDKLPKPNENKELTEEQIKEMRRLMTKTSVFFADPELPSDLLRPEKIYDVLYKAVPKCSKCGRLGVYKTDKPKVKHTHHVCPCDECCGDFDIFGMGDTLDQHMDTIETPEALAKRIADGARMAKTMGAGNMPAELEEELGLLVAPRIRYQDFIRSQILRSREGNSKNDWSRFRSRALAAGMVMPRRKNNSCTFGILLDTSLSMDKDQMALGISQLQVMDDRGEGILIFCDAAPHWDKPIKLKKFAKSFLQNIKAVGRGGTSYRTFFNEYEKKIGKMDFLIVITDGELFGNELAQLKMPKCPVYWLLTSSNIDFNPKFGRVFKIED